MEAFGTFKIDHKVLEPGLYLARKDKVSGPSTIYTLDIRTVRPYREHPMSDVVMHSVEHILAIGLEKQELQKIYFGPMGCATGFYYLFASTCVEESSLVTWASQAIINSVDLWDGVKVPFNSEDECGNCRTLATSLEDLNEVALILAEIRELAQKVLSDGKFSEYVYL